MKNSYIPLVPNNCLSQSPSYQRTSTNFLSGGVREYSIQGGSLLNYFLYAVKVTPVCLLK